MITITIDETRKNIWSVLLRVEKALVEKNASDLQKLLSDDFIGATPTGAYFTKQPTSIIIANRVLASWR